MAKRKTIEPDFIESDDEKKKLIEKAGSKDDHKGMDTVCVYDHTFVDVEESGLGNTYKNRLVKILTESGAAQNGVLRFDYDPNSTLIRFKNVRVHRKSGGIEEVDVSSYRDLAQPQRSMFWGPRMKIIDVPRLEPGDALEYTYFSKGVSVAYLDRNCPFDPREEDIIPPMEGVFFEVFIFEEPIPVKHKKYTVTLKAGMPIQYGIYNGEAVSTSTFDDERITYTFEKKNIDAYKNEPRMHAREETLTKLVLTTLKSWEEKSKWFWKANEGQFEADQAVRRKVAEIVKGKKTLEEKARALLHWAAQEIRYIGYCLCKGEGYTIHQGSLIFHERGGVCKESAGMLVTLLRAAGFTTYAALTQSGARVEDIPADQFNHCVTALKKPDGTYMMLDPTWAVFSQEMFCTAEQEQNYVIGSPEGETLMMTPYSPPEKSPLDISMESAISADGALRTKISIKSGGRSDTNLRRAFGLQAAANIEAFVQKLVGAISPDAEVEWFKYSDPRDMYKSIELEIKAKSPAFATAADGMLLFPSPLAKFIDSETLVRHLEIGKPPERKYAAMSWYTQKVSGKEKISLPKGYAMSSKAYSKSLDHEIIGYDAKVEESDGGIGVAESVSFKNRNIKPDAYKKFKEGVDEVKNLSSRFLAASKK